MFIRATCTVSSFILCLQEQIKIGMYLYIVLQQVVWLYFQASVQDILVSLELRCLECQQAYTLNLFLRSCQAGDSGSVSGAVLRWTFTPLNFLMGLGLWTSCFLRTAKLAFSSSACSSCRCISIALSSSSLSCLCISYVSLSSARFTECIVNSLNSVHGFRLFLGLNGALCTTLLEWALNTCFLLCSCSSSWS